MKVNPDYERLPLLDTFLRDYQKEFIEGVRSSFRAGHKAVLGVMPTGMGKTTTAVALPKEGASVMVICQQSDLVTQWVSTIRHLRRRAAAIEKAFDRGDAGDEWIVATWQTLQSNDRFKRFLGHVDLIVTDEADSWFSTACRSIMQQFIESGARVLGITATPHRTNKAEPLFGFYTDCGYSMELRDAFAQGWLVKPKVTVHRVKSVKFDALKKGGVDYKPEELDRILTTEAALHDLAGLAVQVMQDSHNVLFANSVRQASLLRDLLSTRHGISCSLVHGKQSEEERSEEMRLFRDGTNKIICNCRVLGRGVDVPEIKCIINGRPTKSKSVYMQMLGRGTRALPGTLKNEQSLEERLDAIAASAKPHWHLHDITSTVRHHCPITAIEILAAGPREIIERIKEGDEGGKEKSIEELDEDVAEEVRRQKEMDRLEREAEKRRRSGLVVGVEFESASRELFSAADAKSPYGRTWRFMFGKYKGRPLADPIVPLSYLEWYGSVQTRADSVTAVAKEIRRRVQAREADRMPAAPY